MDQLLSPLSEHGRRVHRADKINLLAIKALGQMHKSRIKAVDTEYLLEKCGDLPVALAIMIVSVSVSGPREDVARDCASGVRPHELHVIGTVPA